MIDALKHETVRTNEWSTNRLRALYWLTRHIMVELSQSYPPLSEAAYQFIVNAAEHSDKDGETNLIRCHSSTLTHNHIMHSYYTTIVSLTK